MKRKIELRQLVPMGGEADSPIDPALYDDKCPSSAETSTLPYVPTCNVAPLTLEETSVPVEDEEIDQVAQALVREYLNRKKLGAVLKQFDEVNPRNPASISSRAKLRTMLGLGEPHKLFSILEQIIAQRIVDTRRGHHVTLGDAPFPQRAPNQSEVRWDLNGSTVSLGGFVIDDSGTKRGDRLAPQKKFCDLETNKTIDHISDLDLSEKVPLGKGAGGEVFAVIHKPTGKQVAVKVIKALEQRQMEEIQKELRTLFDNNHDNIVKFHGAFYDQGNMLIALERMEESLNSIVRDKGPMPEPAARACVWQALNALNHLHTQRKIIHRDIKPANILFNAKGDVKVSDFGVSSGPVASLDGNVANTFIGTLAYMSPERCRGGEYSFASDVWSLGLVLYYLVTGQVPFNSPTPLFSIIEGEPPLLEQAGQPLSKEARDFYAKCIARDPDERSSCKALLLHPWFLSLTQSKARDALAKWLEEKKSDKTSAVEAAGHSAHALAMLDEALDM